MKTLVAGRPRLVCRLVRGWVSVFGDAAAGQPRGFGAAHVASCDDCRRFFQSCDALEQALRRDASRQLPAMSAGLEQRIIRAVNLSRPESPSRPAIRILFALAGAAACLALAVLVFQRQVAPSREATATQPVLASDDVWVLLKPSAEALLTADPLQHEVDGVVSDAQSAVRFLERNFLPSPAEPKDGRG